MLRTFDSLAAVFHRSFMWILGTRFCCWINISQQRHTPKSPSPQKCLATWWSLLQAGKRFLKQLPSVFFFPVCLNIAAPESPMDIHVRFTFRAITLEKHNSAQLSKEPERHQIQARSWPAGLPVISTARQAGRRALCSGRWELIAHPRRPCQDQPLWPEQSGWARSLRGGLNKTPLVGNKRLECIPNCKSVYERLAHRQQTSTQSRARTETVDTERTHAYKKTRPATSLSTPPPFLQRWRAARLDRCPVGVVSSNRISRERERDDTPVYRHTLSLLKYITHSKWSCWSQTAVDLITWRTLYGRGTF